MIRVCEVLRSSLSRGRNRIYFDYLAAGISVGGHPLEHKREQLKAAGFRSSSELRRATRRARVKTAGLVIARQQPSTSKGTVFLLLEDEFGWTNVIVRPELYAEFKEMIKFSAFLGVEGRVEVMGRVINLVAERVRAIGGPKPAAASHDFR